MSRWTSERQLRGAAESGDPDAQNDLAQALFHLNSKKEAVEWFRRAAARGHAKATYNLGCCLRDGTGVGMNEAEGHALIRKAAEQGFDLAMAGVAWDLTHGEGVALDMKEGLEWYRKGAALNNPTSLQNLGGLVFKGVGTPVDEKEGLKLLRKAALLGAPEASKIVPGMLGPLPAGWEMKLDEKKDVIFVNRTTNTTTTEDPREAAFLSRTKSVWDLSAQGDAKGLDELLKKDPKADLNQLGDAGSMWPLGVAAMYGRLDVVEVLLKHKADPNYVGPPGAGSNSPLAIAASNGDLKMCEVLVQYGAKVTAGVSPVYLAAGQGRLATVEFLIKQGASADSTSPQNWTALFAAASKGRLELCKLLVSLKANPNVRCSNARWTPLQVAQHMGQTPVVDFLRTVTA